jgi:hypothetical protein
LGPLLRAAYEYNISDKSNFNIAYTSFISPSDHSTNDVSGSYQTSRLDKHDRSYLHNVSATYQSPFGLKLGADYTNYHAVNHQYLQSTIGTRTIISISTADRTFKRFLAHRRPATFIETQLDTRLRSVVRKRVR